MITVAVAGGWLAVVWGKVFSFLNTCDTSITGLLKT